MAIKKFRLVKTNEDEMQDTLHLETSADLVLCSDGSDVATKLANTVPVTRTVNGKSLAIDIALTAADVNALGKTETASAATKLATARTIRTNLGSTSAVSFDGSANITPGVTGVLPVANGGTGSSSEKYLKLAGGTVTGAVTFSANPINNAVTTVDGVTIQGNLRLKGSGNYGNTLRLGDGDYVHLSEPTDDCLEIKAKEINFITTNSPGLKNNGAALSGGGGVTRTSSGRVSDNETVDISVVSTGIYLIHVFSTNGFSGSVFLSIADMGRCTGEVYEHYALNSAGTRVVIDKYIDYKYDGSTTLQLISCDMGCSVDYALYKIG